MKWVVFLILLFSIGCNNKKDPFPDFKVLKIDSTESKISSLLEEGKPIWLMYFSPDCEHCQQETDSLLKNIDRLKKVQLIMATTDDYSRLKVFNKYYQISKHENIILIKDVTFFLPIHYKINTTPYNLVFNKEKDLKYILSGIPTTLQVEKAVNLIQ